MSRKSELTAIEKIMAANDKNRPYQGNRFYPDPTPVAPPAGYQKQPSMIDIIKNQVEALSREMGEAGHETFEEANDFDIDDDAFPASEYETEDEVEVPPSVLKQRQLDELDDQRDDTVPEPPEPAPPAPEPTP